MDLIGIANFKQIEIVNLEGNPMLLNLEWKVKWNGTFSINLIY